MIKVDEGAFICDMAETYHVFDYKSLPVDLLATLASGLRETSRIRAKMADSNVTLDIMLLAGMYDKLTFLAFCNTADAQEGKECPAPILPKLLGIEEERKVETFASGEDFEAAWKALGGM